MNNIPNERKERAAMWKVSLYHWVHVIFLYCRLRASESVVEALLMFSMKSIVLNTVDNHGVEALFARVGFFRVCASFRFVVPLSRGRLTMCPAVNGKFLYGISVSILLCFVRHGSAACCRSSTFDNGPLLFRYLTSQGDSTSWAPTRIGSSLINRRYTIFGCSDYETYLQCCVALTYYKYLKLIVDCLIWFVWCVSTYKCHRYGLIQITNYNT